MEDIFHIYGVNVHEWLVCQVSDNCSVDLHISRLLEIPMVGCYSHRITLEIRKMFKDDDLSCSTLDSVRNVMRSCKQKHKNRALLHNITHMCTDLFSETRWSGAFKILRRFIAIREDLISVANSEGADIELNRTISFRNRVIKYER